MPDKNYHAEIVLCRESPDEESLLNVIKRSITAEVLNPVESSMKSAIELIDSEECLKIRIDGDNINRVRAIVNSYLYLISTIEKTVEVASKSKQH